MLSVTVNRNEGTTRYSYELRTSGSEVGGALEQEYSVEVHESLVHALCNDINDVLKAALDGATRGGSAPGDHIDHRARLAECGQLLYQHLFRPTQGNDEPEIAARIRLSQSPLLVRTNESVVPWELLHDGTDFLGLTHDLGQGSVVRSVPVGGREVNRIERALIVGDPLGDLRASRSEAEHVAEWLTAKGTRCTLLLGGQATLIGVVRQLRSTPFDLLHYCGHVSIMSRPAESGLMLHGREILNEAALRTATMVGAPPVVFINGCQSARPIANLCVSFMTMGAKVVVGTRAEVSERSAERFAEEFYQRLLDDQTAGSAVRNARHALLDEADAGWASFLLYSNPGVHITGGPPPSAPAEEERQANLSASAIELLRRAYVVAESSGLVTSVELLFALITETELQATMVRGVGAERLAMLSAMLHMIVGTQDGTGERRSDDIQLSDTVHGVLLQAEEDAEAQGRTMITPRDIALAFAETDGGSAAEIPEVVGVTVRQLFRPGTEVAPAADSPTSTTTVSPAAETDTSVAPTATAPGVTPRPRGGDHAEMLDDNGKVRAELLGDGIAKAVTAALVLASGKRRVVESHTFLQGFGVAGSTVLRRALEAQGSAAEQALHVLYAPGVRPGKFTQRSFGALTQAWNGGAGAPISEAAVLCALLSDRGSAAHMFLEQLGVDADRLLRDLRSADRAALAEERDPALPDPAVPDPAVLDPAVPDPAVPELTAEPDPPEAPEAARDPEAAQPPGEARDPEAAREDRERPPTG